MKRLRITEALEQIGSGKTTAESQLPEKSFSSPPSLEIC
jgi:hypothetical protein